MGSSVDSSSHEMVEQGHKSCRLFGSMRIKEAGFCLVQSAAAKKSQSVCCGSCLGFCLFLAGASLLLHQDMQRTRLKVGPGRNMSSVSGLRHLPALCPCTLIFMMSIVFNVYEFNYSKVIAKVLVASALTETTEITITQFFNLASQLWWCYQRSPVFARAERFVQHSC